MANTIIQIKKSTANQVPSALSSAELGYSYVSEKLFIGSSDGLSSNAIGGKFFVDQQNTIYALSNTSLNVAQSAFAAANAATGGSITAAFDKANAAMTAAQTAFSAVNSNSAIISTVFGNVNANAAVLTTVFGNLNTNAATISAHTTQISTIFGNLNTNAAVITAAFGVANSKFASSGGTISGDVQISGALTVTGNVSFVNSTQINVTDPMIYLAANNTAGDVLDIGVIANYVNATSVNVRTGIFRDAGTKEWYLFKEYTQDPGANSDLNIAANNFTIDVLNATVKTSNLILGGANALVTIGAAYGQANTGVTAAGAAFGAVNANAAIISTVFTNVNANASILTGAYTALNANAVTVAAHTTQITTIFGNLNANAAVITTVFGNLNTNAAIITAAFGAANTAQQTVNASNLTTGTVPSARISGSYTSITGVGTIGTGLWQGSTINVAYGGTGIANFTNNGILFGNTTGSLRATAQGAEGNVLQVNAQGTPFFGMLDGGTF